ncbi:hypothetical protein DERF_000332 [Dermatophagoides farinae]|uniref:Uncharacterized protein n=1 Tax=Dermatophagoides farinae TaxID=6954 RepID=A0A922I8G2_DERFA|nr:hypothetical protein DERF_000332 [Dermatophagoides farinae]
MPDHTLLEMLDHILQSMRNLSVLNLVAIAFSFIVVKLGEVCLAFLFLALCLSDGLELVACFDVDCCCCLRVDRVFIRSFSSSFSPSVIDVSLWEYSPGQWL